MKGSWQIFDRLGSSFCPAKYRNVQDNHTTWRVVISYASKLSVETLGHLEVARCAIEEILAGKHEIYNVKIFFGGTQIWWESCASLVFLSNCNVSEKHQMTRVFL